MKSEVRKEVRQVQYIGTFFFCFATSTILVQLILKQAARNPHSGKVKGAQRNRRRDGIYVRSEIYISILRAAGVETIFFSLSRSDFPLVIDMGISYHISLALGMLS
jgi:hypothetical protein